MAHTQSAKKRIRQTIKRTAINRSIMSRVRTLRKKVAAAVAANDKEAAVAAYNTFASAIDKAAKKAGITKISHVDSYTTSYVWGIVAKQVTKVYGE